MDAHHQLPEEGLDLRQQLLACYDQLFGQALLRTNGDRPEAARLLGSNLVWLARIQRILLQPDLQSSPTPASEAPTLLDLPRLKGPSKVDPEELGRLDQGVVKITRSVIRRLAAEGDTPRQIANKLGVNTYFIEKVLRGEAELLSKCDEHQGPTKRGPE
jgi:hypothetical protein